MKRKWILAICACMLLAGCGQESGRAEISGDGGSGQMSTTQETVEREVVRQEAEVPVEVSSLARTTSREIAPVECRDEFQRAAFLADQIYESNQENVLVSPLSLDLALGLAAEGASGETAKELYAYLGDEKYGDYAQEYMNYAEQLTRRQEDQQGEEILSFSTDYTFQYTIANSVWVNKQRKLVEGYQSAAQKKFLAEVDSLDFQNEIAQSLERINSWCNEKTNGLIPAILNEGNLQGNPAAILVNSVYFESPWLEKWGLDEHEFTGLAGVAKKQEMLTDILECYYENPYATAFSKDYFNGFQFIGILPKEKGDFQIGDLDLKSLLESRSYDYDVDALMPKLDFETATAAGDLVAILRAQGVKRAFDSTCAEFEGMLEMQQGEITCIDDILQKCKIELDEEGTRAAAVTAMIMKCNGAMPMEKKVKEVYLDRPFAFLIYDSANDKIVFAGKVTELPE